MAHLRYRDHDTTSHGALYLAAGAVAGLAVGILVAQRLGGLAALSGLGAQMRRQMRRRLRRAEIGDAAEENYYEDVGYAGYGAEAYDELEDELTPEEELEERVLEAFRNDPILSERAVDIGALGEGIIELTGWVHGQDEIDHAKTITRGTPGVDTVVNRLTIRDESEELEDDADDYDEAAAGGRWEGQQVGTGRRRQGTSQDADRHADPKPILEDKWLSEEAAIRDAAEDIEGLAERRKRPEPEESGDRTGGAPVAPTGVPKADHVVDADKNRPEVPGRPDLRSRAD